MYIEIFGSGEPTLAERPLVAVVMGSSSDKEVMGEAIKVLRQFEIPFECQVLSAHRSPKLLHDFAGKAAERGLRIIIAGAGGAAHLPGVIAALTPVPVFGVPMPTPFMGGLDSLLSIVQMPGGIPVATFGIGKAGAKNAAVFAAQVLASGNIELLAKLMGYWGKLQYNVVHEQQPALDAYVEQLTKKEEK